MKLLGITGGIGMGKSTAADLLVNLGVPVIDTDVIARQVVEPGQAALQEIVARFGMEVIGTDGRLRRGALAERVFAEPTAREALEAILHPRIREIWLIQAEAWRQEDQTAGVVVIPLLFETNAAGQFDATICVACSTLTQEERLRPRGWSDQQIAQRVHAQWSVERKMAAADFVVWSEGSLQVHLQQLQRILHTVCPGNKSQGQG